MTTKEAFAIFASLESMRSRSIKEIMEAFAVCAHWRETTDWNYRAYANMIIGLTAEFDSEKAAIEKLRKHGASEASIKNAMRLVQVYYDYVKSGHASLAWFESLNCRQTVLINRATRRHDRWTLRREPIFDGSPAAWIRIEALGAGGM